MSSRLLSLATGLVTMLIAGAALACPGSAMKSADKGSSSSAQTAMVR